MSDLLTIVIPTRDRIDLLKLALASVYEHQVRIPPVIVSDNSTQVHRDMAGLRRHYGFTYVRQSGHVPVTQHHNACLAMPSTPWVWMLHDDDEVMPAVIAEVESALPSNGDVGIIIGGVEYMDGDGRTYSSWVPIPDKTRGEQAARAVGLDWQARAPSQIFSVDAARNLGGYADTAGVTGDYAFAVLMAKEFGVTFYPRVIGRFRVGHPHAGDFNSSPARMSRYFEFLREQLPVIAASGCSRPLVAELSDYLMWNTLWQLLHWRGTEIPDLATKTRFCMRHSPGPGEWLNRVRSEYPILFWHPTWFWRPLFRAVILVNALLKRISGGRSSMLSGLIRPLVFGKGRRPIGDACTSGRHPKPDEI